MGGLEQAAGRMASLFDDGGVELLARAGLGVDWISAIETLPSDHRRFPDEADGLTALTSLRDALAMLDRMPPALALTEALLELRSRASGPRHPDALVELGALGALQQRAGRVEEGARHLARAWEGLRTQGVDDLRAAVVASNLALHHARVGRWLDAEPLLARAYAIRSRLAPGTTSRIAAQLAEARTRLGREREALALYEEAWRGAEQEHGATDPRTLARARTYGVVLNSLGEHHLAVEPLRAAVEHLAEGDERALARFELGVALDALGRGEEGLRLVEEAVRWTRGAGGPHPELSRRLTRLANLQLRRGHAAEAEGLLREALEADTLLHGDSSPEVAVRCAALGDFCARAGRRAEALGWLDPAASLLRSTLGDADPRTRSVVTFWLGLVMEQAEEARRQRDRELAVELVHRAWSVAVPVLGHGDRQVARLRSLADALALRP